MSVLEGEEAHMYIDGGGSRTLQKNSCNGTLALKVAKIADSM